MAHQAADAYLELLIYNLILHSDLLGSCRLTFTRRAQIIDRSVLAPSLGALLALISLTASSVPLEVLACIVRLSGLLKTWLARLDVAPAP